MCVRLTLDLGGRTGNLAAQSACRTSLAPTDDVRNRGSDRHGRRPSSSGSVRTPRRSDKLRLMDDLDLADFLTSAPSGRNRTTATSRCSPDPDGHRADLCSGPERRPMIDAGFWPRRIRIRTADGGSMTFQPQLHEALRGGAVARAASGSGDRPATANRRHHLRLHAAGHLSARHARPRRRAGRGSSSARSTPRSPRTTTGRCTTSRSTARTPTSPTACWCTTRSTGSAAPTSATSSSSRRRSPTPP